MEPVNVPLWVSHRYPYSVRHCLRFSSWYMRLTPRLLPEKGCYWATRNPLHWVRWKESQHSTAWTSRDGPVFTREGCRAVQLFPQTNVWMRRDSGWVGITLRAPLDPALILCHINTECHIYRLTSYDSEAEGAHDNGQQPTIHDVESIQWGP